MAVDNTHSQYNAKATMWERCRDCCEGSDAVKAKGQKYLPQLTDQTPAEYEAYKSRANFYGATGRTVNGLVGMVFRKEPKVELPAQVEECSDDITLTGVPLESFLKEATKEVITVGRYGVLVDMPPVDSETADKRPYIVPYSAEQIINWRVERIEGKSVLTMVVLEEYSESIDPKDPFGMKEETVYRVLSLEEGKYQQRVWRKVKGSDGKVTWVPDAAIVPIVKGNLLDFIPFIFLSPVTVTPDVDKSPIYDLALMNLSHYTTSADLEHGRHFTALPTAWLAGFDTEKDMRIGSATAWVTNNTDAKVGMLEFTGQGLGALERAQAEKEDKMAALGARMLEKQKLSVEAAEAIRLRQSGEQSVLQSLANAISLGMTRVMQWFADFMSASGDVSVELNTEFFEASMNPAQLKELVAMWQGAGISKRTLFYNLKKGNVMRPDVTFEEEQQEILKDGVL